MTIETIEKRIEGKKAAIEKLNKKLERINKAKSTNWEKNPYRYSERDLDSTLRDIEDEEKALKKYEDMLEVEQEKANSRDVEAIVEFLEQWKEKAISYYLSEKERYDKAYIEYRAKSKELTDAWNSARGNTEARRAIDKEEREHRKQFSEAWMHLTQFQHGSLSWEETMKKDIEIEKNRKYDSIIERTNAVVGQITDASNLRVGDNGELNGIIIGSNGKTKVETIGAGGWNIQCAHFRTLVKPLQ